MKLWDKLKNANTINKVFIFAIILLIVLSIIGGIYILTRNNNIENIDPGIAENKIVQAVAQNISQEDVEENLIEHMDNIEDKAIQTEDNQESQVNKVDTKTENTTNHSTDVSQIVESNKNRLNQNAKNIEKIAITDSYTVGSKVKEMFRELLKKPRFIFNKLYKVSENNKQEVVTAFTGLLELSRRSKVKTTQEELFGDIVVEKAKKIS